MVMWRASMRSKWAFEAQTPIAVDCLLAVRSGSVRCMVTAGEVGPAGGYRLIAAEAGLMVGCTSSAGAIARNYESSFGNSCYPEKSRDNSVGTAIVAPLVAVADSRHLGIVSSWELSQTARDQDGGMGWDVRLCGCVADTVASVVVAVETENSTSRKWLRHGVLRS